MLGAPPGGDRDDDGAAQPQEKRIVGPVAAPSSSPRELVLACADRLHRGDVDGARRAVEALLSLADPRGDAADRLAHHFASALARRVVNDKGAAPSPSPSAYLAYNQIVPFLRFAHLTANQAILEAAAAATGAARRRVHIVDLDAAHGVQWPPLLQAIAERADPDAGPPEVRITGVGTDRDMLHRTGDRLRAFARSLNLSFRFHPLLLPCPSQLAAGRATGLELHPDETLVINCVLFLHKLRGEGELADFLRWVRSTNPTVVTIAEREAASDSGDGPEDLPRRVAVAMDYYAAVFDALETMLPPGSVDRLAVENEVLGQEIEAVVGPCPASGWRARRFEWWASAARAAGLSLRPLSTFAVVQARFLLRLHYPSEGYVAEEARGACFLGWQRRPLMSVSSWQ